MAVVIALDIIMLIAQQCWPIMTAWETTLTRSCPIAKNLLALGLVQRCTYSYFFLLFLIIKLSRHLAPYAILQAAFCATPRVITQLIKPERYNRGGWPKRFLTFSLKFANELLLTGALWTGICPAGLVCKTRGKCGKYFSF